MSTAFLRPDASRRRLERGSRTGTHNRETRTTEVHATVSPRPQETEPSPGPAIRVAGGSWFEAFKTTADFVLAATILLCSLPAIVLAFLAIKLTSRGPAFYTQLRLGKGGRPYVIYKLRSMYHDCERKSGIQWSTRGDPRVTPVGWFLRKSHIDELPQLWNVLRGEMSLIGPRPERPELVAKLEQDLPYYRDRLLVKPGLTGLAQIQLPPDTDLESVRKKLFLDRVYVSRRSFGLDVRIFLATLLYLCRVPFPTLRRWFRLPHELKVVEQPSEETREDTMNSARRRSSPLYTTVSVQN